MLWRFGQLKPLIRGKRGVTGLETAIILIAFVVVASVFAFTILSTGIFSAERGKETVFAGLQQASGSVELKGSVLANGVADIQLSDADAAWTDMSSVTATIDSTDKKEADASGELAVAASKTGLLAYEAVSPTEDLSSYDSISLWVKSSLATSAGDLQVRLSTSATCATAAEDIDLPALAANTWKNAVVGITSSTTRTSIACVGLVAATAYSSAATVNFDDIVARGQITSVVITIANSIKGEPIDLTPPSDSDDNGISDAVEQTHKLLVSYSDDSQLKNDLYWESTFVGVSDDDNLLEEGERGELTVHLSGLDQATPLVKNQVFTLEIKPAVGSTLVIERTAPAKIDTVMNLQ